MDSSIWGGGYRKVHPVTSRSPVDENMRPAKNMISLYSPFELKHALGSLFYHVLPSKNMLFINGRTGGNAGGNGGKGSSKTSFRLKTL